MRTLPLLMFMGGNLAPGTTIVNQLFEYTNGNEKAVLTCDVMVSKPMSPEERAKVFKALADPRRVEIVELLAQGSQCGTVDRRIPRDQRGVTLSSLGSVGRRGAPEERAPRPTARLHARCRTLARCDEHGRRLGPTASPHARKSDPREERPREERAEIGDRSAGPTPTGQKIKAAPAALVAH